MNSFYELIVSNEEYPPPEHVWRRIVDFAKDKATKSEKIKTVLHEMETSYDKYKPKLPEPMLVKVSFKNHIYFIDHRNYIYTIDKNSPMVGNKVGEIKNTNEVWIQGELVHTIPNVEVKHKELYEKNFYVNQSTNAVYKGVHPKHNYVHHIGKLAASNKIVLQK